MINGSAASVTKKCICRRSHVYRFRVTRAVSVRLSLNTVNAQASCEFRDHFLRKKKYRLALLYTGNFVPGGVKIDAKKKKIRGGTIQGSPG